MPDVGGARSRGAGELLHAGAAAGRHQNGARGGARPPPRGVRDLELERAMASKKGRGEGVGGDGEGGPRGPKEEG